MSSLRLVVVLALLVAMLVGPSPLQVQCEVRLTPSVNQNGLWVPNPVQEVKNELNRMKHRLSFEHFVQRRKQEAYQQVPGLNKLHHLENKFRNIKNALRS